MLFPFYRWRKLSPEEVSNLATQLINGREGTRILIHLTPKPKLLAILLPVRSLSPQLAKLHRGATLASVHDQLSINQGGVENSQIHSPKRQQVDRVEAPRWGLAPSCLSEPPKGQPSRFLLTAGGCPMSLYHAADIVSHLSLSLSLWFSP